MLVGEVLIMENYMEKELLSSVYNSLSVTFKEISRIYLVPKRIKYKEKEK